MGRYDAQKEAVLHYSRRLSEHGYFGTRSGSSGNVSALVEGEEAIVVTPSGKPYVEMTEADMCVVGFDGRRIECPLEPSIETPMHVAVYRTRPDVNAVVHSHQIYASVPAVVNEPIPALFDEVALAIGPVVEVVPYGLSGSADLLQNVVSKLGNRCHCYILQNHGALCVGASLEKAFYYVELLEKNALIYCMALATGKPVNPLPEPLAAALFSLTTSAQDREIARKQQAVKSD